MTQTMEILKISEARKQTAELGIPKKFMVWHNYYSADNTYVSADFFAVFHHIFSAELEKELIANARITDDTALIHSLTKLTKVFRAKELPSKFQVVVDSRIILGKFYQQFVAEMRSGNLPYCSSKFDWKTLNGRGWLTVDNPECGAEFVQWFKAAINYKG